MTTGELSGQLAELVAGYRELAALAASLAEAPAVEAIAERLGWLLENQGRVTASSTALHVQLLRAQRATTETQRLATLREAANPDPADIALALVRADWVTARDALRIAVEGEGALAELAQVAAAAVQTMLDARPSAMKSLENVVRNIERTAAPELVPLRGAFLLWLGRSYRDGLSCTHLAVAAFHDSKDLLPEHPEPRVELAELARRSRNLEAAQRGFTEALALAPHRAGAHLGLAAMHEEGGAWLEAAHHIEKAADIVSREIDPVAALDRLAPVPLGSAYLRLAEVMKDRHREAAIRALDRALETQLRGPRPYPEAEVYRARARLVEPADADQLCEAGQRLLWRGDLAGAEVCFDQALELQPDLRRGLLLQSDNYRMRAYEAGRTLEERRELLQRSLHLSDRGLACAPADIEHAWVLTTRAYVLDALATESASSSDDGFWDAISLIERALILEPTVSFHLTAGSRIHRRRGHRQTANALLAAARTFDPGDVNVLEDSVRIFANSSEFDQAMELIPRLPDTAWRRAVEGLIRVRQRKELEVARSYLESALQVGLPETLCWANIALGMCCNLLKQPEIARARFEAARAAATTHLERAETAIWCQDFPAAIAAAAEGRQVASEESSDLVAILAIAQLGAGNLDAATRTFAELVPSISGPVAENWRIYIASDLEFLSAFVEAPSELRALRDAVVGQLAIRAASPADDKPPAKEIDALLGAATGAQHVALRLTRARLAVEAGDDQLATEHYRALGEHPAARDGLARTATRLAAAAARRGDAVAAQQSLTIAPHRDDLLAGRLETASQAAILVDVLGPPAHRPVLDWLEGHLGLQATPRAATPSLTLTMPTALSPPDGTGEWPFLTATIPEVRRILQARFGATIPAIAIRWDAESDVTCQLWIGTTPAGSIEVAPANGEIDNSLTIEQAAAGLSRGDEAAAARMQPYTRLGGWLVNIIGWHAGSLTGVQEVVDLLETSGVHDAAGQPQVRRTGHLVRLTRLARSLLAEQVALAPWPQVTDATRRWRKRSIESLLSPARLQLRSAVAAAVDRAGGELVEVPRDLERSIASYIHSDGAHGYLAAGGAQIALILSELAPMMESHPLPTLVVSDGDARVWVRRVVALQWPTVIVVSREELQRIGRTAPPAPTDLVSA